MKNLKREKLKQMGEVNGNREKEVILQTYLTRFGELPAIPFIQCSSEYDDNYIEMIRYAMKAGRPVDEKIRDKFFPTEEDVLY